MSTTTPTKPAEGHYSRWILLAIASGTFAALNGLFAKLTTSTQTKSLATSLSHLFHPNNNNIEPPFILELIIRILFFTFNILSNITMWALFTRALTASPSTTKVSITNTASNFLVTAVLGMLVFGEVVGGLWLVGAGLMGGGCVLVGMAHR